MELVEGFRSERLVVVTCKLYTLWIALSWADSVLNPVPTTDIEAIAVGATNVLVVRDKSSAMIHADAVRGKEIDDEFPSETTTAWILGLGYPEVTITTDGESSVVALSRKITEKIKEAGIKAMQNTSAAFNSR